MRIDSSKSFSRGRQRKNDENIEQYRNHQQREMRNEFEQQQRKKQQRRRPKVTQRCHYVFEIMCFGTPNKKFSLAKTKQSLCKY